MAKPQVDGFAEFNDKHNPDVIVPNKIRAALASLLKEKGPNAWAYDADVRTRAKITPADMEKYRHQFKGHVILVPDSGARDGRRKVWVADVKKVAQFLKTPGASQDD